MSNLSLEFILSAHQKIKKVVRHTPLIQSLILSDRYQAKIFFKREDMQVVRSYKIRGAYNKISCLNKKQRDKGIVCASAGNHAQGVAYACEHLKIKGIIFMPNLTPLQKINQVKFFGKNAIKIVITGDSFDDSFEEAHKYCQEKEKIFIHPFNDVKVIEGQGTIGPEIMADFPDSIDYLFVPIGGGGLISGLGTYMSYVSPKTRIVGVEPKGSPAMKESLDKGKIITLKKIDTFVDGAAVKRVGENTFNICQELSEKKNLAEILIVSENKICNTIINLYNEGIVTEPAGSLSVAGLDSYKEHIKNKNVVCIISGSNSDITRIEEIKKRAFSYLLYEN